MANHGLDFSKGLGTFFSPILTELFIGNFIQHRQRRKDMGLLAPHIAVKINHPAKGAKLLDSLWRRQGKDWFNLLLPGFQAHWCHPVANKPVHLFYSPFTLLWIDCEAVFF